MTIWHDENIFRSVTYTAMRNWAYRVLWAVCAQTHTTVHGQLTLPSCAKVCPTRPALWVWRTGHTKVPFFTIFILFIMIHLVCFIWGTDTISQQKSIRQKCYLKGLVGNQVYVVT